MNCVVCDYRYNFSTGSFISFHLFPKEPEPRAQWLKACNLTQVGVWDKICSLHFTKDSFVIQEEAGLKVLKPSSVPTKYLDGNKEAINKILEKYKSIKRRPAVKRKPKPSSQNGDDSTAAQASASQAAEEGAEPSADLSSRNRSGSESDSELSAKKKKSSLLEDALMANKKQPPWLEVIREDGPETNGGSHQSKELDSVGMEVDGADESQDGETATPAADSSANRRKIVLPAVPDIDPDNCTYEQKALYTFELVKYTVYKNKQRIKRLSQSNRRLRSKINEVKALLRNKKKQVSSDDISDEEDSEANAEAERERRVDEFIKRTADAKNGTQTTVEATEPKNSADGVDTRTTSPDEDVAVEVSAKEDDGPSTEEFTKTLASRMKKLVQGLGAGTDLPGPSSKDSGVSKDAQSCEASSVIKLDVRSEDLFGDVAQTTAEVEEDPLAVKAGPEMDLVALLEGTDEIGETALSTEVDLKDEVCSVEDEFVYFEVVDDDNMAGENITIVMTD